MTVVGRNGMSVTAMHQLKDGVFGENTVSGAQHVSRETLLNGWAERSFNYYPVRLSERIGLCRCCSRLTRRKNHRRQNGCESRRSQKFRDFW